MSSKTCILAILIILALLSAGCSLSPAEQEATAVALTMAAATNTPTPTNTPLPTDTLTSIPPTTTHTPTNINTPIPTNTLSPTHTPTPTSTTTPTPMPEALVSTDTLNLRGGPGTVYSVVGQASSGDLLLVLARTEDSSWLEVETSDGNHAWVSVDLVELSVQPDVVSLTVSIPPTPLPPTATPTPEKMIPKAGNWQGGNPAVTFNVGTDGNIHNFELTASFGGLSKCTVKPDQLVIDNNGTFDLVIPLAGGIKNHISGRFESATKLTGTYLLGFCMDQGGKEVSIMITSGDQDSTEKWSAEWKGP